MGSPSAIRRSCPQLHAALCVAIRWILKAVAELADSASGDCKSRGVGLSGSVASLVVVVPRVTRRVTGRRVRALGVILLRVCGGAGLAPAAGLIRSLSALLGVTHYSPAAAVSVHSDRR